jgi:hypothetical protein
VVTKTDTFTVTNRQVITALAAVVVMAGSFIINTFVFDDREALQRVKSDIADINFLIAQIQRDNLECERRNEEQQINIDNLEEWRDAHIKWGYESLKTDEARFSAIENKVNQCMEHMRNEPRYYERKPY